MIYVANRFGDGYLAIFEYGIDNQGTVYAACHIINNFHSLEHLNSISNLYVNCNY